MEAGQMCGELEWPSCPGTWDETPEIIYNKRHLCSAHKLSPIGQHPVDSCH